MDDEKKEQKKKQALPGTGEQYLLALIRCADWIPSPYKYLAEQYKGNTDVVKELYLCACDDVPLNDIMEIVEAQEPEKLAVRLHTVRMGHLGNGGNGYGELNEVKEKAARLEKEVKNLSDVVRGITEQVPGFDAMFPDADTERAGAQEENAFRTDSQRVQMENASILGTQEDVPESGTQNGKKEKSVLRRSGWKKALKDKRRRPFWKKETSVPDYVEELLEAGYDMGQIDYILSCIETGMSIEAIRGFASPKLPVNVMSRLQTLEQQKEQEEAKKKEGEKQDGK